MTDYKGASVTRPLTPGVYAPIPTFFLPVSQDLGKYPLFHPPVYPLLTGFYSVTSLPALHPFIPSTTYSHPDGTLDPSRIPRICHADIPTFQKHILKIATADVGILICGSMGEAHHLTPDERLQLICAARNALDGASFSTVPIIVGTGAGSTRETIRLTKDAAEAGADYAIVIPSGYYASSLDRAAIKGFFQDVAEASPIPVMLYNCEYDRPFRVTSSTSCNIIIYMTC
jgi:Dihydrodipicolinate synthetase family